VNSEILITGSRPLSLENGGGPDWGPILILAPHPDDFDEVGVTLLRFAKRGGDLHVMVLSSSPNGVEDRFCNPPTDAAKAALREEEQRRSAAFFGLRPERLEFLRLPTGNGGFLLEGAESFGCLRERVKKIRPSLAVLPHGHDTNPDHRLTSAWWRRLALPDSPAKALFFRDPKTVSMRLDAFSSFGDEEAAWKSKLLRFHRSQQDRNLKTRGYGLDERILRLNRMSARELGLREPYAEAFEIG